MEGFSITRYRMIEKFRWMILIRFFGALFMFLVYFFVKKMNVFNFPFAPFAACCFLEAFVNQPYPFIARRFKSLELLAYVHLILDVALVSAIIHFLGGIEFSFFSISYPLIIIIAGVMLSSRACYIVATTSSAAYSVVVFLEFNRLISHIPLFGFQLDGLHQFGIVAANILFFYFVAFLSGYSTDALAAQTKRLEEEKRFSDDVISTMADGLIVLDPSGKAKRINKAVEGLSGYSGEELIGASFPDLLLAASARAKFRRLLEDARKNGIIKDEEATLLTKGGTEIPVSINASLVEVPEEEGPSIVAILRDISKEKANERMKMEFLSTVTHELFTPLTSVSGFVSMILEGKVGGVSEKQKEFLEIVSKQTKLLKSMIGSLLDFSRSGTGRFELNFEPIQVEEVVSEVVRDMGPQIEEKELKVEMKYSDGLPRVYADRIRLGRVFNNLLVNAIKFTSRGRSIKIAINNDEKGFVKVSVSDEGIGLAKEHLEKIFERFFQVDAAFSRVVGGVGMGLAIAKEIIEKHGGKIWAESVGVGCGTTISLTLPGA